MDLPLRRRLARFQAKFTARPVDNRGSAVELMT